MKLEERAVQFWSVLVLAARSQQLLSYTNLSELTGIPREALGTFLGPIAAYCDLHKVPQITSIVVSHETGLPGEFYPNPVQQVSQDQARSFVYDWLAHNRQHKPSSDSFKIQAKSAQS
jgi:hypothetical protein